MLSQSTASRNLGRTLPGYGVMIALAVGLFFLVRWQGVTLVAPAPSVASESGGARGAAAIVSHPLLHLLLVLVAMIVVGRFLGHLLSYLAQPPVIGEVLAGICLGPSLLGRVWPEAQHFLLPADIAGTLSVVAQIGVVFYMFLVGLELNLDRLKSAGHVTLAISHASIVLPFSLGAVMALWLYPMLSTSDVPFTAFALFLCVSLSITAFPVLARILSDRRLTATDLGAMALACAAVDDVSAWCLLALVVGVARSQMEQALLVVLLTVAFIALMFCVIRPLAAALVRRSADRGLQPSSMALVLVGVLASALLTEAIGVHAIFGAFLFGAVIPHDSPIARALIDKLTDFITILLLPAFFAYSGMRTEIGLVTGWHAWLVCLAIIAVATLGKFGGTLAAARVMGLGWRDASGLGILMNTRGLMELVVLNIGLDLGIVSPTLFAMMVLMALVTTMATGPILTALITPPRYSPSPAGRGPG